ncbi:hypothetical protein Tco_1351834 [Tanacetum coccineum]
MTVAEQLKDNHKTECRHENYSSHASGSGADEGTGVTPGVPDAPDYDSEDDISWKSSDDDQEDKQAQDDEDADKNDVNETTQDDENDDEHDVDEKAQDDDDEEQTESDDDGDDFVHPKLTTHDDDIIHEEETNSFDPIIHTPSCILSSDDEDSDNEVEGTNVEGAKSDEELHMKRIKEMRQSKIPIPILMEEMILKGVRDNSGTQTIKSICEALSSISSALLVDQYLANKMQEAVDVAVQLKYDRIREESNTANPRLRIGSSRYLSSRSTARSL